MLCSLFLHIHWKLLTRGMFSDWGGETGTEEEEESEGGGEEQELQGGDWEPEKREKGKEGIWFAWSEARSPRRGIKECSCSMLVLVGISFLLERSLADGLHMLLVIQRDPLRIFYETLYKQLPHSEMAQFW